MRIRDGLGDSYRWCDGETRHGCLTLHETGELLRRAAREAGLVPVSEFPLRAHGKRWEIDWVWKLGGADGPVVAAFEIDGRDVDPKNTVKAQITLGTVPAPFGALVRFQVAHGLGSKPAERPHFAAHAGRFDALRINLLTDEQLMAPGGIEGLIRTAREIASGTLTPRAVSSVALESAVDEWNDNGYSKARLVFNEPRHIRP